MCDGVVLSILTVHLLMFLPLDREDSLFTLFGLPLKSSIILRLCRVQGMRARNGLHDGEPLNEGYF